MDSILDKKILAIYLASSFTGTKVSIEVCFILYQLSIEKQFAHKIF